MVRPGEGQRVRNLGNNRLRKVKSIFFNAQSFVDSLS